MFNNHGIFGGGSGGGDDAAEEIHLNLTPMIDVLTCLLFFLLLSFGAVIIALVNSSVPTISDGDSSDTNRSKTTVTLGVSVTKNTMLLTVSNDAFSEEELNRWKRTYHANKDGFNWKELNEYCYTLKKQFQKSSNVMITPEPDIDYEVIIKVMDATREKETLNGKRTVRLPLFPEAVISTIVK